jgi:hypothetical protein
MGVVGWGMEVDWMEVNGGVGGAYLSRPGAILGERGGEDKERLPQKFINDEMVTLDHN